MDTVNNRSVDVSTKTNSTINSISEKYAAEMILIIRLSRVWYFSLFRLNHLGRLNHFPSFLLNRHSINEIYDGNHVQVRFARIRLIVILIITN